MVKGMANENASTAKGHPILDLTTDTSLEEPDMDQVRQERFNRNRAMMRKVDAHVSDQVLPNEYCMSVEQQAAIKIQAYYRGYLGRKKYVDLLYEQYEKEYERQRQKTLAQMEEGELLVENHRLQVEYEDNLTTRKNKLRQVEANCITIQRAWRKYAERKGNAEPTNKMPPYIQVSDVAADTDSISGPQPMSISTSIDSLKNARSDEDILSDVEFATGQEGENLSVQSSKDSLQGSYHDDASRASRLTNKNILLDHVDTDPESVVSDYSEMADAIKEHLANVQIIRQEDLDSGNALPNEFLVQRKIPRLPEETDAEYAKRLRKLNFLSLAQEFAELKKIDSEALPFGAHKAQLHSPMSESTTSETSDSGSAITPMEVIKGFPSSITTPSGEYSDTKNIPTFHEGNINKQMNNLNIEKHQQRKTKEAWKDNNPLKNSINNKTHNSSHGEVKNTSKTDNTVNESCSSSIVGMHDTLKDNINSSCMQTNNAKQEADGTSVVNYSSNNGVKVNHNLTSSLMNNKTDTSVNGREMTKVNVDTFPQSSSKQKSNAKDEPDSESHAIEPAVKGHVSDRELSSFEKQHAALAPHNYQHSTVQQPNATSHISKPTVNNSTNRSRTHSGGHGNGVAATGDGDFDVYNMESTLPQMDWDKLEHELQRAAEEERQKKSRKNDRQEILRKLAMGGEEEGVFGAPERALKKANIQTRFLGGQSLQLCFMNEPVAGDQSAVGENQPKAEQQENIPSQEKEVNTNPPSASPASVPGIVTEEITEETDPTKDADLMAKQQQLQHEATIALAQVPSMAKMQLQIEKKVKKKSPIAEITGIPELGDGKILQLTLPMIQEMTFAQLQVVVNDLHTQIENLNMELVNMLIERDDLHMEQDSMLVDIEDLHRRAEELADRVQSAPATPKHSKKDRKN